MTVFPFTTNRVVQDVQAKLINKIMTKGCIIQEKKTQSFVF